MPFRDEEVGFDFFLNHIDRRHASHTHGRWLVAGKDECFRKAVGHQPRQHLDDLSSIYTSHATLCRTTNNGGKNDLIDIFIVVADRVSLS